MIDLFSTRTAVIMMLVVFVVFPSALISCHQDAVTLSMRSDVAERKMLTPLMSAAGKGDLPTVEKLLGERADVNAADADGYTALHYAVHCGDVKVVRALLAAGADVNARTKNNVTPLINSINMACGKPEISLVLIESGADVNVADSQGNTALWIATTESSPSVIEALLRKGADPNVQSKSLGFVGDTPLHMAAANGLVRPLTLLLEYHAKTTIQNARGQTASDVIPKNRQDIRDLVVKYSRDNP
jgi:ankyrin repeat protein